MELTKKRQIKDLTSKWSLAITLTGLIAFALWFLLTTDYRNTTWVYYLIPVLIVSFVMAAVSFPLDKKIDKNLVIRSTISLILSLILVLFLGFIYVSPVLFPFGFPTH